MLWSPWSCHSFVIERYQSRWGCTGRRQSFVVAIGYDDLPQDADSGRRHMRIDPARVTAVRFPRLPIQIDMLAHCSSGAEADEIVAVPGRILYAFGVVRRIPQRRIGPLQWLKFHRHRIIPVMPACKRQPFAAEPGEKHRQRLIEHRAGVVGIDPMITQFVRDDAAANPQFQPPTRDLVEHRNFFDQPQRIV
jgi:hypothetical protein